MCSRDDDPTQIDWAEAEALRIVQTTGDDALDPMGYVEDVFTFDTTRKGVIESGPDGWDVEASSLGLEPGRFPQVIKVGEREFELSSATYAPGGDLSYATYRAGTLLMRVYND